MAYSVINGDALSVLRSMGDGEVQCCVTSPPYWGLRDYKLEPLVWGGEAGCGHQFEPHRTVRKGSTNGRPDLGSTLVSTGAEKTLAPGLDNTLGTTKQYRVDTSAFCSLCGAWRGSLGLEPTPELYVQHLVEIFREVRRVLRGDGTLWLNLGDSYVSQGGHTSGGGSSQRKGRTNLTEQNRGSYSTVSPGLKSKDLIGIPWRVVFALQSDGWWLRSDVIWHKPNPMPESVTDRPTKAHEYVFLLAKSEKYYYDAKAILEPFADSRQGCDGGTAPSQRNRGGRKDGLTKPSGIDPSKNGGRNRRSVWTIATKPYKEAHFATFPPALVEPMILAGCPPGGVVLDPFAGAGTTLLVAESLGRNSIGIEPSPDYCELIERRLR